MKDKRDAKTKADEDRVVEEKVEDERRRRHKYHWSEKSRSPAA